MAILRTVGLLVLSCVLAGGAWGASSQQNRDDSLLYLGISPVGLHLTTLATHPAAVGVYLGDSVLLAVEYGKFSFDVEDEGDRADGDFTNAGVFLRWYLGNSFNLGFGLHQRDWNTRARVTVTDESSGASQQVNASLKTEASVFSFILGNQWMTDFGLTFGVDWLVLSGPLSSSSTASIDAGELGALSPNEVAEAERDLADLGDILNIVSYFPGVFVISIGWSF